MDIEEIRRRLKPMNVSAVARAANVSRDSVYRLIDGETDPLLSTLQKVADVLKKHAKGVDITEEKVGVDG